MDNIVYNQKRIEESNALTVVDPAVKVAQAKLDRAKERLADLEEPLTFDRRATSQYKAEVIKENQEKLKEAREEVRAAQIEISHAGLAALDAPYKAERETQAAKERERQEAAQQAKRAADLARVKSDMRSIYMQQPGATADAFEKAFPELLEERNRRAVLAGDDAARQSQWNYFKSIA